METTKRAERQSWRRCGGRAGGRSSFNSVAAGIAVDKCRRCLILSGLGKVFLLHADHDFDSDTLLSRVKGILHLAQHEAVGDERPHIHPAARHQGQCHRVAAQEISISEYATDVHFFHRDQINGQGHLGLAAPHRHQYAPRGAHLTKVVQRFISYVVPVISKIICVRIGPAPIALAVRIATSPMGPAPSTNTGVPGPTSARLQEYTATASGSSIAPSSSLTSWQPPLIKDTPCPSDSYSAPPRLLPVSKVRATTGYYISVIEFPSTVSCGSTRKVRTLTLL
ncbi:hypothetical protein E2C01_033089 [Portunus trituberculatus]|uniref:Uncharacterized protein n=1 Tax=Portunus trituberculatus TaxID=210409 RepID=A0A5B7F315_PORTR|nr:hypothetical protein [Portunus trituberculatus]